MQLPTPESLNVVHRNPSEWTKADLAAAEEKIKIAKTTLALREPFFAVLALRLKDRPHSCAPFRTMMVSKDTIYYNVDYTLALSGKQALWLICHETLHPALGQLFRRGNRDPLRWNIAMDAAVNTILKDYGIGEQPPGVIQPEAKYEGKTAEEIYDELLDEFDEQGKQNVVIPQLSSSGVGDSAEGDGDGEPGPDDGNGDRPGETQGVHDGHVYVDGESKDQEREERKWQKAMIEAVQRADEMKKQGSVPSDIRRAVESLISPKVPWQRELMPYIQMAASDDYSWQRYNRRYIAHGFLFPTMRSPSLPEIAIHIDTSGSMSAKDITESLSETLGLLQTFTPEKLHFLACDAGGYDVEADEVMPNKVVVKDSHEMTNKDATIAELMESLAGGGGTSFVPTFNYLKKHPNIRVVILMTDGYGEFPNTEEWKHFPTFWVSTESGMPIENYPFGRAVHL